jgi:hypothetical protein
MSSISGNGTIPTTALTVKKQGFGCTNFDPSEVSMDCRALQNNDPAWLP